MDDSILDLRITFSGNEEVLNDICTKLLTEDADHTRLGDALSAIVKHTLIAAGVSREFNVKFEQSHVVKKEFGPSGGGLNVNEWQLGGLKND